MRSRPPCGCSKTIRCSTPRMAQRSRVTARSSSTHPSWTAAISGRGPSPACGTSRTRSSWHGMVMEKTKHVLLIGARRRGTRHRGRHVARTESLLPHRGAPPRSSKPSSRAAWFSDLMPSPQGTVGAVAFDKQGNLAAATSTGGMTNKRPGRVGDSPDHRRRYLCQERRMRGLVHRSRRVLHPHGGCVRNRLISRISRPDARTGRSRVASREDREARRRRRHHRDRRRAAQIVMDFNSQGMFRGARDSNGARMVGIGPS